MASSSSIHSFFHPRDLQLLNAISSEEEGKTAQGKKVRALIHCERTTSETRLLKTAQKVARLIPALHEVMQEKRDLEGKDRLIVNHFIKELAFPDSETSKIVQKAIALLILNKTLNSQQISDTGRMLAELEQWYNQTRLEEVQNRMQLSDTPELAQILEIERNFIESTQPGRPMAERLQLGPRELDVDSAGHSYIASLPGGEKLAIIKSSTQGMCAEHNPSTRRDEMGVDTHDLNGYGLVPGQDVLGEAATFALFKILGLSFLNAPATCLQRITHHFLGAPNQVLMRIKGESGFELSETACQQFLCESSTGASSSSSASPFSARLINQIADKTTAMVADDVKGYCGLSLSIHCLNAIQSIFKECESPDAFKQKLIAFLLSSLSIAPPDGPYDLNSFSAFKQLLLDQAAKASSSEGWKEQLSALIDVEGLGEIQIEELLSRLAQLPDTAQSVVKGRGMWAVLQRGRAEAEALRESIVKPQQQPSHLCSVQKWMPLSRSLKKLSAAERSQMAPFAFQQLAIVDGMSVQRDRNTGNILVIKVTTDEIKATLNENLPGLAILAEQQLKKKLASSHYLPTHPHAQTLFLRELGDEILTNLLADVKTWPLEKRLTLESNLHKFIYLLFHGEEALIDSIPIDNAMSFPNPLLPGFQENLPTNNAWIMEQGAQRALMPYFLKEYLSTVNIVDELLPQLDSQIKHFHQIATAKEAQQMPWTPAQRSLFVLSCHIVKVGAQLDKTAFEIGLMKDHINLFVDDANTPLIKETPLIPLFKRFFMRKGKLKPLDQVDFRKLDKAISKSYLELSRQIGTFADGFAAWNQAPGLLDLKELVERQQYQAAP